MFFSVYGSSTFAEGVCATEQCEKAQHIPNLPSDVKLFVERRDGCDHFRGEPWPEADDPESKERREFILRNIRELCTGTDGRLAELRNKYRNSPVLSELLNEYEDRIELK